MSAFSRLATLATVEILIVLQILLKDRLVTQSGHWPFANRFLNLIPKIQNQPLFQSPPLLIALAQILKPTTVEIIYTFCRLLLLLL